MSDETRTRSISGWPAFLLVVLPMLIGYFVIIRAVIEALF